VIWGTTMADSFPETQGPPRVAIPRSSLHVLVVDDNDANRRAFQTLLDGLGYSVFLASSGDEALALATRTRFAVILMDVRMPVMDGLETAVCLRKKPFCRTTPIVFVSAHQHTARAVSLLSLEGPIGYVHSPVDSDLLVWQVKCYVDLYLKNERIRLQSALVWQAEEQFQKNMSPHALSDPALYRSGQRLREALHGLKELLSDRLGVSGD